MITTELIRQHSFYFYVSNFVFFLFISSLALLICLSPCLSLIIIIIYSPFSMLYGLDCSRFNCGSPCILIVHQLFIQLVFIQIPIYDLLPRLEGSSREGNTVNNSVRVLHFSQPIIIIFPWHMAIPAKSITVHVDSNWGHTQQSSQFGTGGVAQWGATNPAECLNSIKFFVI